MLWMGLRESTLRDTYYMHPRCNQIESRDRGSSVSGKAFPSHDRFFRNVNHLLAFGHGPFAPPLSASNGQWEQFAGVVILKPSACD
jgi:hypothetical protein